MKLLRYPIKFQPILCGYLNLEINITSLFLKNMYISKSKSYQLHVFEKLKKIRIEEPHEQRVLPTPPSPTDPTLRIRAFVSQYGMLEKTL
jgi:hypothetical protein